MRSPYPPGYQHVTQTTFLHPTGPLFDIFCRNVFIYFNEDQIKALTSFTYNLGRTNLLRLTENGTRGTEEIADMILEYDKVGNTVKPGLTERRKAEYELFSAGSIAD